MNYRRGFQRVYTVLTVAWIGVYLFALPAERLRFWQAPIDYDALPLEYGVDDSYAARARDTMAMPTPPPAGYVLDHSRAWYEAREKANQGWSSTDDYAVSKQSPPKSNFTETRIGKTLWLASLLFAPPLIGYVAIFLVIPWIFRGFKAGTQI